MAEVQTGFFWHVHHRVLLEWCYSYNERASYISEQKREDQKETRLRLFKPVKGKLPQEVVEAGRVLDKAWHAYDEAGRASDKAWHAYNRAGRASDKAWHAYNRAGRASDEVWQAYNRARRAYVEAGQVRVEADRAYNKAQQVYNKAWRVYDEARRNNMPAIEALHKEECHDCPWNGKTIFPNA